MDLTSDPVAMSLTSARRLINLQIDRAGYLHTDVSLKNQLPASLTHTIDGVTWYYQAVVTNTPFSNTLFYTDLLLWVTQGLLFRGTPAPNPLTGPVTNTQIVPNGITGYVTDGGFAFWLGKRVRFLAYGNEMIAVQEGGLLPVRFYFTQVQGTGFWWAAMPTPTSSISPALSDFVLSPTGTGLSGDYQYIFTFADERFREGSPSAPITITLSNQGAKIQLYGTADANLPGIGGGNVSYAYAYRAAQGTETFYRIARATITPLTPLPYTFAAGDFLVGDGHAYDDATDAFIVAEPLAPDPGENDPPHAASVGCVFQNRIVLNDTTDPNTLQVSNLNSTTQFNPLLDPNNPSKGARILIGSDQGNAITAVVPFGSVLAVFKRRGAYFIYGDNPTDFVVRPIHKRGCVAPDSATRCDNVVCFLSDDGVYAAAYEGGDVVNKISKPIERDLLAVPEADFQAAFGFYSNSCYYLVVADIIYQYNFDAEAWTSLVFGSSPILSLGHGIPDAKVFAGIGFGELGNSGLYGSIVPCEDGAMGGDGTPCDVAVSPSSLTFDGGGGTLPLLVTPANGASTPYQSFAPWLDITGPATGPGTAIVACLPNLTCFSRMGAVQVCGTLVPVTQTQALSGCSCVMVSLTPDTFDIDHTAQTVTTNYVETDSSAITEHSFAPWLHPQTPISGGPTTGHVDILVDANDTCQDRTGQVQICNLLVTVSQAADPGCGCNVVISPTVLHAMPGEIGSGSFQVTNLTAGTYSCIVSPPPGGSITVTFCPGNSGAGVFNCTFDYSIPGTDVMGTITLCGTVFTIISDQHS